MMPLSTRRLVETAFQSLVDSGIDYRGKNIGCYTAGVAFDMFSISGHVREAAVCCTYLRSWINRMTMRREARLRLDRL